MNVGAFNPGAAAGSVIGGAIVASGGLRWTRWIAALLSLAGFGPSYLAVPRESVKIPEPEVVSV
ncbi:hypothetical protein [Nocardia panacis]|uniref:hypothetical protein n=1 Tax=Nocardia panacis TaxID=2340916 RepID=UPI0019396DD8|nr:hypothetical protein [Nocardia panacis]